MKLATLEEYRRIAYAEGSAPTIVTLRRRIKEIPGGCITMGRYYVDLDKNRRVNDLAATTQFELDELMKNPLLKAMNREK